MSVLDAHNKSYRLRDWHVAYDLLPIFRGMKVLDLGAGLGLQARDLAARGAHVVAVESDIQLVEQGGQQAPEGVTFVHADMRFLDGVGPATVGGIWASFSLAHFPDLLPLLRGWCLRLRPGGWIALMEASDLFAHSPLDERARVHFNRFCSHSLQTGRFDFQMGRKLRGLAEAAGLDIVLAQTLPDKELSFNGPAPSAVLDAWKRRLAEMRELHEFSGQDYAQMRLRLMACLIDESHRSEAKTHFILARSPKKLALAT